MIGAIRVDNGKVDLQRLHRLHHDERGIVISWLVRILVGLALAGVVLFDAAAIVVNYFSVNDTAGEVALAVATDVASGQQVVPNLECNRRSSFPPCATAYQVAREKGVRIKSARFDQEGLFHVEIRSTAETLIVGRIGAIEDWATATASADADTN
jgi:hypothetical protein